ncbi:glucose-6-phosphate isomerase [Candidatus Pelagibacter sp.]|nr:glucose-6-phosphate isomerase [Candidatus Pelagibacter sp.]
MKITEAIYFKNFKKKKVNIRLFKLLKDLTSKENQIIRSLTSSYQNSYSNSIILKLKKYSEIKLIGMGGSTLGARAIYSFLKDKIKKNFIFVDSLEPKNDKIKNKKSFLNLIISKSGNTLETITNANILVKKNHKNIFITQNQKSYLMTLAKKLKAEVIHHNDFIGGRYSVLSEVGMLPAELMGLKQKKFRQFNNLIKNKNFMNSLILNVSNIHELIKKKRYNSIILNYDKNSYDLFSWYQQLVAESLGKKGKGLLPVISSMPRDNHSLMQYYLDGNRNSFFTFFFVRNEPSDKIVNKDVLNSHYYLKNKNVFKIREAQFLATQKVFKKKNIPFRSFHLNKRNEKSLGELFTFFILETILLGKLLNINPYNQPAVELIKTDTKKILL